MGKFAKLSADGNTIDSITLYPDRVLVPGVPAKKDEDGNVIEPAVEEHWGELIPGIIPVDDNVFAGYIKQGPNWVAPATPAKPLDQILGDYKFAFDQHLDRVAQARQYDNRYTITSYVTSKNPTFKLESQQFVDWRDEALASMFESLAKVQSGEMEQPSIEGFIDSLPEAPWALGE